MKTALIALLLAMGLGMFGCQKSLPIGQAAELEDGRWSVTLTAEEIQQSSLVPQRVSVDGETYVLENSTARFNRTYGVLLTGSPAAGDYIKRFGHLYVKQQVK